MTAAAPACPRTKHPQTLSQPSGSPLLAGSPISRFVADGYAVRFGVVYVEYSTLARYYKASALWAANLFGLSDARSAEQVVQGVQVAASQHPPSAEVEEAQAQAAADPGVG